MNRYKLEVAAAGDIHSYIDNVALLWTQLPDISWERVKIELLPWYERMAKFGVVLASKLDFQSEAHLRESIEQDIVKFTIPNDLIVDPFCGGSTVGEIALALNRNYYGCDISQIRINESESRLYSVVNS